MVTPVDDAYSCESGGVIAAGCFSACSFAFTNGVPGVAPLEAAFPNFSAPASLIFVAEGELPAGVSLDSLGKKLIYDGTPLKDFIVSLASEPTAPSLTVGGTGQVPVMAGIVFPKGRVFGDIGASVPGLFVTVKRCWNDGSVKHAIVTGVAKGGTQVTFNQSPQAGTALTVADLVSAAPSASVSLGAVGSVTLTSLLSGTPTRTWIATPGMIECHYRSALTAANVFVEFRVRLFANGAMFIRVLLENSYRIHAQNSDQTLTGTITIDGANVHTYSGTTLYKNTLHVHDRWAGVVQFNHLVKNDMRQVMATKLVPHYGMTDRIAETSLAGLPTAYAIGERLMFTQHMGGTGYQAHIGLLPNWEAMALVSNDDRAVRSVFAHGQAIFNYPVVWREGARMLLPTDYPNANLKGAAQGGATQLSAGPLTWEEAHHPSVGYLAYLLSGDPLYLDALLGQCALLFQITSTARGQGTSRVFIGQTRGVAWSKRTIGQAAAIVPDDHVARPIIQEWVEKVIDHSYGLSVGDPQARDSRLGYPSVYSTYSETAPHSVAPWMHHFWIASVGYLVDMEPLPATSQGRLKELSQWMYRGITGILGYGGKFNHALAGWYSLTVSDEIVPNFTFRSASQLFKNWADVWESSFPGQPFTNTLQGDSGSAPSAAPTGFWGNLMPALAYAVDHKAEGAAECLARLEDSDNYSFIANAAWATTPVWGITPRPKEEGSTTRQKIFFAASCGSISAGLHRLPLWRRNMAPRSWALVSGNTLSDIDPAKNPAINPRYPNNPEWRGNTGQASIVLAWCGACFDAERGVLHLPLSGGHADYAGNEPYRLDLSRDAPVWEMIRPPSGAMGNLLTTNDGQETSGVYADGQPRAIHSYNCHVYVQGLGPVLAVPAANAWSAQAGRNATWVMDEATGLWTRITDTVSVGQSIMGAATYDPNRHCLWWMPGNDSHPYRFDLATRQWAIQNDLAYWNYSSYRRLIYLADEDLLLILDNNVPNSVSMWDLTARTLHTDSITGSAPSGFQAATLGFAGSDWHPSGFIALWHHTQNTASIATLTPTGNKRSAPWQWGEIQPVQGNTVLPTERIANGTYGRFGYSEKLKGYYLQNATNQKTFFFAED